MHETATLKTCMCGANDANLIARREIVVIGGASEFSGPHVIDLLGEEGPYQADDDLMIIATDDAFLCGITTSNQTTDKSVQVRLVCSRIKLTASAYTPPSVKTAT